MILRCPEAIEQASIDGEEELQCRSYRVLAELTWNFQYCSTIVSDYLTPALGTCAITFSGHLNELLLE